MSPVSYFRRSDNYADTGGYLWSPSHEWTNYSDVGTLVTEGDYLKVEKEYIRVIFEVCNYLKISSLQIVELELHKRPEIAIYNEEVISLDKLVQILTMIFRGKVWCKLIADGLEFHFGQDYYLYCVSENDLTSCFCLLKTFLNIEPFKSPYLYEVEIPTISLVHKACFFIYSSFFDTSKLSHLIELMPSSVGLCNFALQDGSNNIRSYWMLEINDVFYFSDSDDQVELLLNLLKPKTMLLKMLREQFGLDYEVRIIITIKDKAQRFPLIEHSIGPNTLDFVENIGAEILFDYNVITD